MITTQAEYLGRTAHAAGIPNTPLADPAIAAELIGAKVGEKTHLLRAWTHGWHTANLRPVEDDDDEQARRIDTHEQFLASEGADHLFEGRGE